MSRARRRSARGETAEAAWAHRRDYVLKYFPGDYLLEAGEFWENEPGVPATLRQDPDRWVHLMAPPDIARDILARRAKLLDRRRRWLEAHDIR